MNEFELRRMALDYAIRTCGESSGEHVLKVAADYLQFLKGTANGD